MKVELTFEQTRVLGVFLEKEVTTPDQYPLSINAITTACNQKSNREPVVEFSEIEVQNLVDELVQLRLISDVRASGRVTKYRHRFYGSEFSVFKFKQEEAAILSTLFLRGPQTPGELRTRSQRLFPFTDVHQVENCLTELANHEDGPFVVKLAREPGKRESRFAHLFSGEVSSTELPQATQHNNNADLAHQVAELTQQVEQLQTEIANIKQALSIE